MPDIWISWRNTQDSWVCPVCNFQGGKIVVVQGNMINDRERGIPWGLAAAQGSASWAAGFADKI